MLTRRLKDQSGFTLVESAVAGLILVIGILGSISVFDSSRRESATGERLQVAQAVAEAELERMRDVPYADLATDGSQDWPGSGESGDPANRVVSSDQFRSSDEGTEPLVLADEGLGIAPFSEPEDVVVDGTSFELSVYRFVSWRDVECQVVDLAPWKSDLDDLIGDLLAQVDTVQAHADALTGSFLASLLTLPLISQLRSAVNGIKGGALTQLEGQLDALQDLLAGIDEIDPCDMSIESLDAINDSLDVIGPALTVLDNAILAADAAPNCTRPLLVVICPPSTQTAFNAAIAQVNSFTNQDWPGTAESLVDSLGELEAADHSFNTKRVTVAVVITPVSGSGPFKPVWATSVVSDPEAGVLGG